MSTLNFNERNDHDDFHNDLETNHRDNDDNDSGSISSSQDEDGMMMSDMFPVSDKNYPA
jgi:hypothetical protein